MQCPATYKRSFFLGKVTALGVLCCCLFDLACFFLPSFSHLALKNVKYSEARLCSVCYIQSCTITQCIRIYMFHCLTFCTTPYWSSVYEAAASSEMPDHRARGRQGVRVVSILTQAFPITHILFSSTGEGLGMRRESSLDFQAHCLPCIQIIIVV